MTRRTHPRKSPSQARARATVDAIVEATAQILRERGYRGATLRRIGDRAGVSTGSIYQYFPSKDALLAAVMERHVAQMGKILASAALEPTTPPPSEHIRAMLHAVVIAHQQDPELHRVLVHEHARVAPLDLHQAVLEAVRDQVTSLLAKAPSTATRDPGLVATVIVSAVDAAVHALILDGIHDTDTVVDELCALVLPYIGWPVTPSRNASTEARS